MPPKDTCTEHGERLAIVETQVERLTTDMEATKQAVDVLKGVVGKLGVAWWIIAAFIVFISTVVGNVAAAHLTK